MNRLYGINCPCTDISWVVFLLGTQRVSHGVVNSYSHSGPFGIASFGHDRSTSGFIFKCWDFRTFESNPFQIPFPPVPFFFVIFHLLNIQSFSCCLVFYCCNRENTLFAYYHEGTNISINITYLHKLSKSVDS